MNCKLHFYPMFRREWVSGFLVKSGAYKIKSIPLSNINIEYSKQSNFNKGTQFPTFNYKHRKHLQNQNVPGSWSKGAKALHWKTEGLMEVNSIWTKEIREIINRCLSDFKPVTTSPKKGNAFDHRSGLS